MIIKDIVLRSLEVSHALKYHMMVCVKCVQYVQLIRGDMLYLYSLPV